ncbi:Restriction endonuclease [Geodermatophilus aquaeductus]|uniref:Restriction endonuclease n=2 Tax=Geodermatophilus aquaeductus TaxID=1564161 RepID=A0A521FU54_9ACTN|nr:Restriction endonuclease [Geodermatophilus aquaeductus]
MRWLGFNQVGVTPVGADEGIDVYSVEAIAQVKMEGVPTGRPVIQNAYGVAAAEGKTALVFSLGGYVHTAIDWANKVGVPLFQFDLQGTPEPVNAAARHLFKG